MECRSLRASGEELRQRRAQVFAASVDAPETNREFADSLGLDYPILSDPSKRVAQAYGVLGPAGYAQRWTFIIGADQRIVEIDKNVRAASHGADVASKLTSPAS